MGSQRLRHDWSAWAPGMHNPFITELLRESTVFCRSSEEWGPFERGANWQGWGRCQEHKMLRVGPLSRVVLLPSVCPLPGQCLLPLQPARITYLPKHLPQAPCWVTSVLSHPLRPYGGWKFTRKEYWSGSPRPAGDLPYSGMKPESPALADGFFTTRVSWDAHPSPPGAYSIIKGVLRSLWHLCWLPW